LDEHVERPTALAERLRLFQKICEAVAFAHAHGVIHRDLKPQNIMLGSFGEVLVLDWGVAKEVGAAPVPPVIEAAEADSALGPQTAHGTILGTPGYMAPEQLRGDIGLLDARTDVYGLGGILYFLVTGRAPVQEQPPAAAGIAGAPVPVRPRHHDRSIPRP